MNEDFLYTSINNDSRKVFRLGLSATYRPGRKAIYKAVDSGGNLFFLFGIDNQMISVTKDIMSINRDKYYIVTGAYNFIAGHFNYRKTLEKRLRQLNTDYIDFFFLLGVLREKEFSEKSIEELNKLKEEGKIRHIGLSTHNRKFAGQLADNGSVDTLMIRYNAAHRGAEQDIFPYIEKHKTNVISFTATRWRYLLRRPRKWPKEEPLPTAGMCYRFVLSNPNVNVCLTAPTNIKQLEANIAEVQKGQLSKEELEFMRKIGDAVYRKKRK